MILTLFKVILYGLNDIQVFSWKGGLELEEDFDIYYHANLIKVICLKNEMFVFVCQNEMAIVNSNQQVVKTISTEYDIQDASISHQNENNEEHIYIFILTEDKVLHALRLVLNPGADIQIGNNKLSTDKIRLLS